VPAKSPKQYRFMAAIASGQKPHKGIGPSVDVAKEFVRKTPAVNRKAWDKK
jgi:hypothetical protein